MKLEKMISKPTLSLMLLTVVGLGLLMFRIIRTESPIGFSFAWNLFLAWVPLFFALVARRLSAFLQKPVAMIPLFGWLLFFPNATYIITDLMHLSELGGRLLWYDSIGIFMVALTGLLIGLYSLLVVHQILNQYYSKFIAWGLVTVSIVLSGFGIYLGRFIRFNSWDIVTNPQFLLRTSLIELRNPLAIQTTAIFALVTLTLYVALLMVLPKKVLVNEYSKNVA